MPPTRKPSECAFTHASLRTLPTSIGGGHRPNDAEVGDYRPRADLGGRRALRPKKALGGMPPPSSGEPVPASTGHARLPTLLAPAAHSLGHRAASRRHQSRRSRRRAGPGVPNRSERSQAARRDRWQARGCRPRTPRGSCEAAPRSFWRARRARACWIRAGTSAAETAGRNSTFDGASCRSAPAAGPSPTMRRWADRRLHAPNRDETPFSGESLPR